MTKQASQKQTPKEEAQKVIQISEGATLRKFADQIQVRTKDLVEVLNNKGFSVSTTDVISDSMRKTIENILDIEIQVLTIEKQMQMKADKQKDQICFRPPIVTIMGHVDHGKTTLLDAIRESNIVATESGGITQHIGAYRVIHNGKPITFIDTPGHEAFTKLRSRGATLTDIVILVVAADDGVMPQTKEAINHAKAANVPIIVAINKIDKAGADPEKVKQQLSVEGLLVESWGGDIVSIDISAKEKTNLNEILEMILLVVEMQELKANPSVPAQGVILEAHLDTKKGPVATVIIQQGTLFPGDAYISGITYGKARALFDEHGKPLKSAEPSVPVEVLGFSNVPASGDLFQVVDSLDSAKRTVDRRLTKTKTDDSEGEEHLTLDQLFQQIEKGDIKELSLIIRADVQGSVEVLKDTLPNLSTETIQVKILHAATGKVSENDVLLATAAKAVIIGYNTKLPSKIIELAREEGVEIRTYSVIYQLIDDIKNAMAGMLEPVIREVYLGRAEVRQVFKIPKVGVIAGSYVKDGLLRRNAEARIFRGDEMIHKDRIASLKHIKENVTEIKQGYECGIGL
ncbi:MAG: translation initiation factor IF-2, partial [Candidatus Aminicenantes bacterium]|nr:translation initiation factor IF-2 [Candidatus Aminicenantes bacterium]